MDTSRNRRPAGDTILLNVERTRLPCAWAAECCVIETLGSDFPVVSISEDSADVVPSGDGSVSAGEHGSTRRTGWATPGQRTQGCLSDAIWA